MGRVYTMSMRGVAETLKSIFHGIKDDKAGGKLGISDVAFFLRFVKPSWKLWALGIALISFNMSLRSLVPMSSKVLIDYVILQKSPDDIASLFSTLGLGSIASHVDWLLGSIHALMAVLIVLGVAYALLELARNYVTMRSQQEFTFNLQTGLFYHMLNLPVSFFKDKQSGYLASRISGDVQLLQYLFSQYMPQLMSEAAFTATGIVLLYLLSPVLTMALVIVMPVYFIINRVFQGAVRTFSRLERENSAQISKDIQEVLSGVEVVKSFGSEKRETGKVSEKMRGIIRIRLVSGLLTSTSQLFMRGAQFFIVLFVMFVGAGEIRAGRMSIGDYVAYASYVLMLSGSLNSLFYSTLILQPIIVSMERLKEIFTTASEYEPPLPGKAHVRPAKVGGHIKFDSMSFAYENGKEVLKGVSFEALPGDVVAIVGASGAGKTTLINLLLKFYRPSSGRIYLDGIDLEAIDSHWLREQVSIVSQDIFLFNDTVENNIRYSRPDASRDEVMEAAALAHIDRDIEGLPEAYGTMIGERGVKLSLGQRQRISMARAFLKGSDIIVMDEPTSSLDTVTEAMLKDSFRELVKGKTAFIISHRASLTELANKVLVIDGGRAVEAATPAKAIPAASPTT